MSNTYSKRIRKSVFDKYLGKCAYCGKTLQMKNVLESNYLQIDHIEAKINGGVNNITNYNPTCKSCNSSKRTKSLLEFKLFLICKENNIPLFSGDQKEWILQNFNINIDIYLIQSYIYVFEFEKYISLKG